MKIFKGAIISIIAFVLVFSIARSFYKAGRHEKKIVDVKEFNYIGRVCNGMQQPLQDFKGTTITFYDDSTALLVYYYNKMRFESPLFLKYSITLPDGSMEFSEFMYTVSLAKDSSAISFNLSTSNESCRFILFKSIVTGKLSNR